MSIVCRFAPSPTGFLHIGSARTALFNYYFAKHYGGKFLLRIEDTDRERSTEASITAILDGLSWLGIHWDGAPIFQFARAARHAEIAKTMVERGQAYYCYATPEELDAMREAQKAQGLPQRYDGRWRDRPASDAPAGVKPAIRIKAPLTGETVLQDLVIGEVRVKHEQMDDMVLLRSDGTPTYMLAVVVDDHDMGITHVIRGDDHLTNAFRQMMIYRAMDWSVPAFAHLPMIQGPDGAKLSKRHGATGVEAYRDMGYLPEALRNYLLRLGWAHGDDEIISDTEAAEWFTLEACGRSPSRFDFVKLANLNGHYLRQTPDQRLVDLTRPFLEKKLGKSLGNKETEVLKKAMPDLKQRAKNILELSDSSLFYFLDRPLSYDEAGKKHLDKKGCGYLQEMAVLIAGLDLFTGESFEAAIRSHAERNGEKLGTYAQPLRVAICGGTVSPPIFKAAALLGKEETLARVQDAISAAAMAT